MGLFGIFRGIGKIIEGVAEGSGKKNSQRSITYRNWNHYSWFRRF